MLAVPLEMPPKYQFLCFFTFFLFVSSCPSRVFRTLNLSTWLCLSSFYFLPPPFSVFPVFLTHSLFIPASEIIYIGPVKGKLSSFLCPLLFSTASSPLLTPFLPIPTTSGVLRSHDICNLGTSRRVTWLLLQRKSGHMVTALPSIRNMQ